MSLKGKKVLVGLTGGIACYKIPYLIRDLRRAEAEVRVIMTPAAARFITPLTLETVSGNPVAVEIFPEDRFVSTRHIDMAEWPDLLVIAPATANFMGKVSAGVCDDLLTTVVCATARPLMFAPAMNSQMWCHPSTVRNAAYLREIGYQMIGPAEGEMACGTVGPGRMVEPAELFEAVVTFFERHRKKKALTGKHLLITAGPCREPLDPVRYLSNRSSGKMGFALAGEAAALGAKTTLVSGPTELEVPCGVEFVSVETTEQMYRAVSRRFSRVDCLIMAAAPADYTPKSVVDHKIKKQAASLQLNLKPTVDILKTMGAKKKKGQILVGFALETENGVANARRKLHEKNLDLVVLNNPCDERSAFEHDTNRVTLVLPGGKPQKWPLLSKTEVARKLLDLLVTKL